MHVTFNGVMENVVGSIEGQDLSDKEFLCMAHLDHYRPGAMDNASGCSVLLEAAETLNHLIDKGELPVPSGRFASSLVPKGTCRTSILIRSEAIEEYYWILDSRYRGRQAAHCRGSSSYSRLPLPRRLRT